ncbi:MAG: hypothetical protein PHF18_11615 [Methanosarcina sp.]|nr:hypothetical protein [Methanosarcina sp.]MDD3247478.1 hypothetical protein [Methanosarcina sp.]MDD4249371.1 hypothetical protein [Methanosarcina sp.]
MVWLPLSVKTKMKEILKDNNWRIKKFIDSDSSMYLEVTEKESKEV